jgi:hypothetical protein
MPPKRGHQGKQTSANLQASVAIRRSGRKPVPRNLDLVLAATNHRRTPAELDAEECSVANMDGDGLVRGSSESALTELGECSTCYY